MAQNSRVEDSDLSRIGRGISPQSMRTVAVEHFLIPIAEVDSFQASAREDVEDFKLKCLEHWRNENDTEDARRKLYMILSRASQDGLLDSDCFKFLMEGHLTEGILKFLSLNISIHALLILP